jgi:predicted nucleic acid-binding protein
MDTLVTNSMNGDSCFVDTNILVYAHTPTEGNKHDIAKTLLDDLWESRRGVLSTQVLQEFCYVLTRKMRPPRPVPEVVQRARMFLEWHIVSASAELAINALEAAALHNVSYWDALIIGAARSARCSVLYTEDLNNGQKFGSLRVVNPFA